MAETYKMLFKLLIGSDLKMLDFAEKARISAASISKMASGLNLTMEVIDKDCCAHDVKVADI